MPKLSILVDSEKTLCYINKALVKSVWRFSSVGRASALQAEGQRFEPVNLHHVDGEVAKWLNAADCNSVPFGSAVRICPSPPLIGV